MSINTLHFSGIDLEAGLLGGINGFFFRPNLNLGQEKRSITLNFHFTKLNVQNAHTVCYKFDFKCMMLLVRFVRTLFVEQ